MLTLRATLRERERPRDLSALDGNSGGLFHRDLSGVSLSLSVGGASSIGVSSSLTTAVGVDGSLLGEPNAGEADLLSSFASLAATGSRGTSDLGGCAFRIGGSSDSDRSR